MRCRFLLPVVLLLSSLAAHAQSTVTLTANLLDLTNTSQPAGNLQLCLELKSAANPTYPVVQPRLIGGGVISVQRNCFKPNNSGIVTTPVIANDVITTGNVTGGNATLYDIAIERGGEQIWEAQYQFAVADVTEDLSTKVPVNAAPAITLPSSPDQLYLRLDGGSVATGAIQAPSLDIAAPIYADRQAGSDMCAKIVAAMRAFPNGGWIQLPQGKFVCTTQLLVPNDGASPPTQPSYRISGVASGGTVQFFPDGGCHGGTILDMQFSASTGKIDSRGLGKLEIDHICFMDSATDFTPFVFDTLTVLQFHHNQIIGNSGHFPAGCCASAPPTQDGQTGIILGGTGTTADGTTTSIFQGYGTSIDHNQFDYCGQCILLQNATNSVNIESNHFFNHITNTTHGPITVNPTQTGSLGSVRTAITNNLIEVGGSKYGIHLVANAQGDYIAGNSCWDANIGVITVDCVKEEASAGNSANHIINPQQDSNTGNLPDSITSSSSRVQNGRFLGAVGATGAGDCTKPIFGASHVDGFGMSINGGAEIFCQSSTISEILNNSFGGEITAGSGGAFDWQHTASPVVSTVADTRITSPAAGVVSFDSTTSGDGLGRIIGQVGLMNQQGNSAHLTGDSADQALFTYTLPANTLKAGKCLNVKGVWFHDTGTTTTTYKIIIGGSLSSGNITGGTTFGNQPSTGVDNSVNEDFVLQLCNNSGVTNGQNGVLDRKLRTANVTNININDVTEIHTTASLDFTQAQLIALTFDVGNSDKVTPQYWKVWIDQ